MPTSTRLNVFVSSTAEDLAPFRAAAEQVILKMDWHPVRSEHAGNQPGPTVQACYDLMKGCGLFILICAFRRGWVPTVDQGGDGVSSITALELARARTCGIPVLAFLANDSWPNRLTERDNGAYDWILKFRAGLNQFAVSFSHEVSAADPGESLPIFRGLLLAELAGHRSRLVTDGWARAPTRGVDYYSNALIHLRDNRTVFFVGDGVFDNTALGSAGLAAQLAGTDIGPDVSLATAAEYRERFLDTRVAFLDQFRELIENEAAHVPPPLGFGLLADAVRSVPATGPGRLIVSTMYDDLLERTLEPFEPVVVAHILRSQHLEHEGKILVLRPDKQPQICPADQVSIEGARCVIYKPLGSPLLHRRLDPALEIDTVVVTEADHLQLFSLLGHERTRIPTAFSRFFRGQFLFLGYHLDFWHYRLVLQVFNSVARGGKRGALAVVRLPSSPLEAVAWDRLGASLVPTSADDFARRVRTDGGPEMRPP
jgi:hypothetical protein